MHIFRAVLEKYTRFYGSSLYRKKIHAQILQILVFAGPNSQNC